MSKYRAEGIRADVQLCGGLHGTAALARRWGVSDARARELTQRYGFPAPIVVVGGRGAWLACEADAFVAEMVARDPRTRVRVPVSAR
jgi:hypothetical protein